MTSEEALAAVRSRAVIDGGDMRQLVVRPRGWASLAPLQSMTMFGVDISTNSAGKVASVHPWAD